MEDRLNDDELKWGSEYFRRRFEILDNKFAKNRERVQKLDAKMDKIVTLVERMYTQVVNLASNPDSTSPNQGQGAPPKGSAGPDQTNAKRRSLDTQEKYAPEMTYDEMFAARDARWSKGQVYRNNIELSMAFPKTMTPQEALHAASRERYWMCKNAAIEFDYQSKRYAISPQWVERFVE